MGGLTGAIVKILGFARATRNGARLSDVTVDPGGGRNLIVDHFSAPGDDSFPIAGVDFGYVSPEKQTGRYALTGYVDPVNGPVAGPGEKRIYGRNATTGAAVVALWLKSNGSAILYNVNGSAELRANGDFVINGVTVKANGDVVMPNSLVLHGKEIDGHHHPQAADSHGDAQPDTGPNA